jgi:hypothetical protein
MFAWLFRKFGYHHESYINYLFFKALGNLKMVCYNCKTETEFKICSASLFSGHVNCFCPSCNRGLVLNVIDCVKIE